MNIYRTTFTSVCPVNGKSVRYDLEIEASHVIRAEDLMAACRPGPSLHEDLADQLFDRFGGRQTMRANHHGVHIETIRGA